MNNKCKKISKNTKHYFVLSGQEDLYFRQEIAVLFKPYNKTKNRTRTSITPTFNNDRKYYTYSFALPSSPVENEDQLEIDHRKRVAESLIEIEDIVSDCLIQLVPKPRSKHKYCGVCRGHYEDYKQHTQGPDHNLFLKKSLYQSLIADMCKHAQRNYFKRESREIEESKIIDLTCEENPVKVAGDSCDVSTPIKMSSCRSE